METKEWYATCNKWMQHTSKLTAAMCSDGTQIGLHKPKYIQLCPDSSCFHDKLLFVLFVLIYVLANVKQENRIEIENIATCLVIKNTLIFSVKLADIVKVNSNLFIQYLMFL